MSTTDRVTLDGRGPSVSVVVPAWRAEQTIEETLESLLRQTEPNWEVVVVDDGSDDSTAGVVASLQARDPRIRLVRQQHGGVNHARNAGVAAALGDWLLFLDVDDLLEPHALSRLLDAAGPDVDLVMGEYVRLFPDGRRSRTSLPPSGDWFDVLASRCPTAIHACLVRREVVEDVGGLDPELMSCADWDLWQRVVRGGAGVAVVADVVALQRVRKGSASQDERRFLGDAVRVIRRAHEPDPRVPAPREEYRWGRPAAEMTQRLFGVACWAAGHAIGAGRDAARLLELLDERAALEMDVGSAGKSLASGLAVHGHGRTWDDLEAGLHGFLEALGARCSEPGLIAEMTRHLETVVLGWARSLPATAGATHGIRVYLGEAAPEVEVPQGVQVLRAEVRDEEDLLGVVSVPVISGLVRGLVLADAIAAQLAWPLLGRYFATTVYPAGADHDDVGWLTLLRELWGRPDWSEKDFYDSGRRGASLGTTVADVVDGRVTVQVGPVVPSVPALDGDVDVSIVIGGRCVGAIRLSARKGISAQELRVAINLACGMELCIAAVREVLLMGARGSTLGSRLEAARSLRGTGGGAELLGRHPHGDVASPVSRHADLPGTAVALLEPVVSRVHQRLDWSGDPTSRVRYVPEVLEGEAPVSPGLPPVQNDEPTRQRGRHAFEALFAQDPDPWRYGSDYEQTKYAETLELLPDTPIDRALEVGCAAGHFTRLLAPRVGRLVAADISELALAAARERCRDLDNVEYLRLDVGSEPVPGPFDLVVCSEMLYFTADRAGLPRVTAELAAGLALGGHILTTHAHTLADGGPLPAYDWDNVPFGAAYIGQTFAQTPGLEPVREIRTPLYRVQLFRKTGRPRRLLGRVRRPRPRVEERPLTADLPPEVAAHVRWEGEKRLAQHSVRGVVTSALPILMYHRIADSGPERLSRYRVSPSVFEEQLDYLRSAGFRGVTLEEWAVARRLNTPLPGRAVLITFDDAYADFAEHAWPRLQSHGFPVTMFVPTAHVGRDNAWDARFGPTVPLLDWAGVRDLSAAGVVMGAHGHSHQPLSALAPTAVAEEAARSRRDLEDQIGAPVTAVAYPYGRHDPLVTHLHGACGFLHGVTTRSRLSSLRDQALALPRIEVTGSDGVAGLIRKLGAGG